MTRRFSTAYRATSVTQTPKGWLITKSIVTHSGSGVHSIEIEDPERQMGPEDFAEPGEREDRI